MFFPHGPIYTYTGAWFTLSTFSFWLIADGFFFFFFIRGSVYNSPCLTHRWWFFLFSLLKYVTVLPAWCYGLLPSPCVMSDYRHVGQSLSNRGHWVRQAVSDVYVKPFRISSHLDEAGCRQDRVSVVQSGQFFTKKLSLPRPFLCVRLIAEVLLYIHRTRRFIRDGSPGWPPRLSHSSWALCPSWLVECCVTSTETVGLLGTGAQDVHIDFHTAPELCAWLMM